MQISLAKSQIKGQTAAPSSKSYTLRALICAGLAAGQSRLLASLESDDSAAACRVLRALGVTINSSDAAAWKVRGGDFKAPGEELYCGDSAATLRFMTAICAALPGRCVLTAGQSLSKRPVGELVGALQRLGVEISASGDYPPVMVDGGRFKGGRTQLRGDISSQYVSALLLAAPLAESPVEIALTSPLESRAYVAMTIQCLEHFGIKVESGPAMDRFTVRPQKYAAADYRVEGDWSSASYLLALGAVAGEVAVSNLDTQSLQGDKVLLEFLKEMGAGVMVDGDRVRAARAPLKGIRADLDECIDLLPTMGVLAALAEGTSEFRGIARARLKESNRVQALRLGLENLGIQVMEEPDKLIIRGGASRGGPIDSFADHRIAMAFSLLGVARGNLIIRGAECVAKTFPEYWQVLRGLGAKIDEQ